MKEAYNYIHVQLYAIWKRIWLPMNTLWWRTWIISTAIAVLGFLPELMVWVLDITSGIIDVSDQFAVLKVLPEEIEGLLLRWRSYALTVSVVARLTVKSSTYLNLKIEDYKRRKGIKKTPYEQLVK